MSIMNMAINDRNNGNPIILYEKDLPILNLIISLKALVSPHAGHGMPVIFLNTQSTGYFKIIKNIKARIKYNPRINIFFFLFT